MVIKHTSYPFVIKTYSRVGVDGGVMANRGAVLKNFDVNPNLSSIKIEFSANSLRKKYEITSINILL